MNREIQHTSSGNTGLAPRGPQTAAISVNEIRAVLLRRKWQIAITFLMIFTGVAVGTFLLPKQYETHMKILVKNERADMVVSAGSNSQSSYQGEVSETQINTEIELLNSDDLLRQVVIAAGLEKSETAKATAAGDPRQIAVERALRRLQHDLKMSPVRKADIIEVDYVSPDPHRAVVVLKQLADSYLEAHLRVHGTPGTYEFFLKQTAHYREEVNASEAKLTEFRRQHDIVLFPQQKEDTLRKASDSASTLLATDAAIKDATRKLDDSRKQLAAADPRMVTQSRTISNQYSVEHLSTMLVELQNKRTQLLTKFHPDDRLVLEANQEIADTQTALEKTKNLNGTDQATDVNPVRQALALDVAKEQAELAGLQARRQVLAEQAGDYHRQLATLGSSTTGYDDLTRAAKEAEDNYLLYSRKTEEARIADSLDKQKIANVAVAENPVEPYLPTKPNVRLNLALGGFLACFLSLGLAFSAEYLQQSAPPVQTADAHTAPPALPGVQFGGPQLLEAVTQAGELEVLTRLPVFVTKRT